MRYIELIGPQAVGKTTLLKELVKNRGKEASWRTYEEAVDEIVWDSSARSFMSMKDKALYLIGRVNGLKFKKRGINNYLFTKLAAKAPDDLTDFEPLIDAQLKCMTEFDGLVSPVNKVNLVNWHMKAVKHFHNLEKLNFKHPVLLDEGPFKTHYGLEYLVDKPLSEKILPIAVIFCHLDIEENVKRVEYRGQVTGSYSIIHSNINDVSKSVAVTHSVAEQAQIFFKKRNVRTVEVNMSHEQSDIKRVLELIDDVLK